MNTLVEFIQRYSDIRARPSAQKSDIESVRMWFKDNKSAISPDEENYIERDDVISIVHHDSTPLRKFLEKHVIYRTHFLWKRKPPSQLSPQEKEFVQYTAEDRVNRAVSITVAVVGFLMLIAPLWVLNAVSGRKSQLGVICGFVLVFFWNGSFCNGCETI